MPQTIEQALADAELYSDAERYRVVKLPTNATVAAAGVIAEVNTPFSALLLDKDEVTLVLEADAYANYEKRLRSQTLSDTVYRLITFDVVLAPDLVGFMAHISRALADAGISILPFAAYSRDHLLVAEAQFEQAMQVLRTLQAQAANSQ